MESNSINFSWPKVPQIVVWCFNPIAWFDTAIRALIVAGVIASYAGVKTAWSKAVFFYDASDTKEGDKINKTSEQKDGLGG